MNWHLIYNQLIPIVFGILLFYISYSLPKSLIKYERRYKKKAASTWEIMWFFICTIGLCSIVAGLLSMMSKMEFFVWEIISIIPAVFSLWGFFESDAKLTITDRIVEQIKMDKDKDKYSHSEF